MKMMSSRVLFW